jgi:hypothetical protein
MGFSLLQSVRSVFMSYIIIKSKTLARSAASSIRANASAMLPCAMSSREESEGAPRQGRQRARSDSRRRYRRHDWRLYLYQAAVR